MKNRFMLAPLTNQQSHRDGRLSEDEFHWLTMRAQGGFAITMTCAVHVQANGQGFPGQLGIFNDDQLEGHRRLAAAIKAEDSLAMVQLHHAGMRSPAELIDGLPLGPSANEETGARALTQLKSKPYAMILSPPSSAPNARVIAVLKCMAPMAIFYASFYHPRIISAMIHMVGHWKTALG